MKAVGLIVEYNPFHNGHKYHLESAMKLSGADISIAIMSGNYLQRGEPALVNKWLRARMAIEAGVDIVIELPSFYSNQGAETFAHGAVMLADKLSCDSIVFGSESGSIEELRGLAEIQLDQNHEFHSIVKEYIEKGMSYPNAVNNAYERVEGRSDVLNPNNILGIEYIKALMKLESNTKALTIKREKVGYHQEGSNDKIASATAIRKMLKEKSYDEIREVVPQSTYDILMANLGSITELRDFYPLIRYSLLRGKELLVNIEDMEEGLWNRLYESAKDTGDFDVFIEKVSNRRYTQSRIKRVLTHILLNIEKVEVEEVKKNLPYIRVLAYSSSGAKYMKKLKKQDLNYIISLKNAEKIVEDKGALDRELDRDRIYKMLYPYTDEKFAIMKR